MGQRKGGKRRKRRRVVGSDLPDVRNITPERFAQMEGVARASLARNRRRLGGE